jgi:hypothetical protein
MLEKRNLDSGMTEPAIKTLLYVKLQIAKMKIGIQSYKLLSNMQKKIKFMQLLQKPWQIACTKVTWADCYSHS